MKSVSIGISKIALAGLLAGTTAGGAQNDEMDVEDKDNIREVEDDVLADDIGVVSAEEQNISEYTRGNLEVKSEVTEVVETPAPHEVTTTYEATMYVATCEGCIGITKTGVDVRDTQFHDGKRVIAVDPNVIALGSTVEVTYADGTSFVGTAQDVGSAIQGNRIDILVASVDEALDFGRQDVEVRVIN